MKRTIISDILKEKDSKKLEGKKVLIKGWIKAFRSNRFIQINDGSCLATISNLNFVYKESIHYLSD